MRGFGGCGLIQHALLFGKSGHEEGAAAEAVQEADGHVMRHACLGTD